MHNVDLLVTLTVGLVVAWGCGYITQRLGLSPILGYVLAGIIIGPKTPGFVANQEIATQLAEIGVILLMFGVGLQFHLEDLLKVQKLAIPGAIGQSLIATLLGLGLAMLWGWGAGAGLVLGLAISVASTVVLIRVLADNNRLETFEGRAAVGWLVVEDIFTVLVLVLLPPLAGPTGEAGGLGALALAFLWALLKLSALAALMLVVGRRVIPWLLLHIARMRSRELFSLTVLALALAIATGSAYFFGASMALGAFLAGMVVGQSSVSHQAAADALPMRDAFAVLFFVSVGMLFDPGFVVAEPGLVIGATAIILVAKPLAAIGIITLLGYSPRTALTVAVGLAQIGEFSFILADLARRLEILPGEGQSVLVAGALISITLNPLLFRLLGPVERRLQRSPRLWRALNRRAEARGHVANESTKAALLEPSREVHALVVGYGPVGRTITRILTGFGIRPVVIDLNVDTATKLASDGGLAIYGDAARREILEAAGIARARFLLVTLPDADQRRPVILTARSLNPDLRILVRAHYIGEGELLRPLGVAGVCYEEAEAAVALAELLLREVGADANRLADELRRIRAEFALEKDPIGGQPSTLDPPRPPASSST